jgi:acetyl esterase/lipase
VSVWTPDPIAARSATDIRAPMTGSRSLLSVFLAAVTATGIACTRTGKTPSPTHANIAYAPAEPAQSRGHLLDLYLPAAAAKPVPVVIWTGGSGWKSDNGKERGAGLVAAQLNPAGLAVAGVSIRSSAQTTFPGQLYDIKAAIRWLRANAASYNLDPDHIGIMGNSSGGWTAAIAAVTGDRPELEGTVGTLGVSSAVQAAVAFYPPTDFLAMDAHDSATSPESQLLGCALQTCPEKARAANPAQYVTGKEPPIMILHGELDRNVPHSQSELLYEALKKTCDEAVFISLPKAGHGPFNAFLTRDAIREGATIRSTSAAGCKVTNPTPFTPTWGTVIEFLNRHLRG